MSRIVSVQRAIHEGFEALLRIFGVRSANGVHISRLRIILTFLCCLFFFDATFSLCLDPSIRISQYGHTAWRLAQDGLDGLPNSITQSKDGYIWVGTANGLFRFDGVRFTRWTPPGNERLPGAVIRSVLGARDGSLYIATEFGLSRLTQGHLYTYPERLRWVGPLFEDKQGNIWTGDWGNDPRSSTFCKVGASHLQCLGMRDGLGCMYGYSLASEKSGSIWIGSEQGICRWREDAKPENYPMPSLFKQNYSIHAIAVDKQGGLWAGTPAMGEGLGLLKFTDGQWKSYVTPDVDGRKLSPRSLLFDNTGSLWIGTETEGLYRLNEGKLDRFTAADGLSSNAVKEIFQDREGTLWVVTDQGVDNFRELPVINFTAREGLADGTASVLTTDRDGNVWIGIDNLLGRLHNRQFSFSAEGPSKDRIRYLFVDSRDALWVGQGQKLFVRRNNRISPVENHNSDHIGDVIDIEEDNQHQVWVAVQNVQKDQENGLFRVDGNRVVERYYSPALMDHQSFDSLAPNPKGGLWIAGDEHGLYWFHDGTFEQVKPNGFDDVVVDMTSDSDGALWLATLHGMMRYKDNTARTLTTANGLPCNDGLSTTDDHAGSHWFYLQCGIVRVRDSELARWWKDPSIRIQSTVFDGSDGAQPRLLLERSSIGSNGRLWSVNGSAVQMLDPYHLPFNPIPPPVHIERLVVDHKDRPLTDGLKLPVRPREIQIDYTGLSYVFPEKVQFRYRLLGHDNEWTDSATRRQAFYNDLSPGSYKFQVMARNNDGVWNMQGATINFSIPPAWYQTMWFRLLCLLSIVALSYSVYLMRIRQYASALKIRFDERIEERTRLARDLHDTLLQTIQGSKMVADNARSNPAEMERMEKALGLLSDWLDRAVVEGRAALNSLRSSTLETNDLAAAFRHAAEDCRLGRTVETRHTLTGQSRDMHPIVRDEIYRIGYEAINNACAHSSGRVVNIALEYGENVTLRVRDDGKGIDLETLQSGREGHFGLKGMHERAERIGARLTLKSVPGKGTEVCLLVPGSVVFKTYQPVKRSRGLHSFFFRRNSHAETTDQHNQHGENAGSS